MFRSLSFATFSKIRTNSPFELKDLISDISTSDIFPLIVPSNFLVSSFDKEK